MNNPMMVAPLSRDAIEKFASAWRRPLGYEDDQRVDMLRIIEFVLPQVWEDYSYEIVDDEELGDAEATTSTSERVIKISRSCYEAVRAGVLRYNFTLAHELGHLSLHTGKPAQLARGEVKAYRNPEWQADTFAAAFLAPASAVMNCWSIDEIKEKFGISYRAAEVRAKVTGAGHLVRLPYGKGGIDL